MATLAKIEVTPITPAVGGIVEGLDVSRPLDANIVAQLREAWLDRGVLFFPKQNVTEEQLDAFIGNFAQTVVEPTSPHEDVSKIHGGDTGGTKKVTEVWHADATWLAEPPMATGLRLVKVPPVGGDTCWSSVTAAYQGLAEPLREMVDKLSAIHWMVPSLEAMGIGPKNDKVQYTHPVVTVHPETGQRALFINEGWTRCLVDIPPAQSAHLLALLYDHIKSPIYTMRWRWSPGDIALWDNRAVQHFAVPDYDSGRIIQRVVTEGWSPRGVAQAR
jgi:taurine dioxygenase